MHKSFYIFGLLLLSNACGRSNRASNTVEAEATPTPHPTAASAQTFKAECVVPGENPNECLAYRLIPVEPRAQK